MGANLTVYCLQELTDYSEFERLCHDLMSLVGYRSIEPLGGFSDKGRDAIHVSQTHAVTVFAYSVREDWRAKLAEDAGKIRMHGHVCDSLVFITTSDVTASERDEAVEAILTQYHWKLDIYGLERLRNLLETQFPQLRANHPQIFPPEFLAIEAQIRQTEQRDHLLINYAAADVALAEWLARRLTSEGYLVWCDRFRTLGGDDYPTDVDGAIQQRVSRLIALYSDASLKDPDLVRQRAISLGISHSQIPGFLIALRAENIPADQLDQKSRELIFVPFETDWLAGLKLLLDKLDRFGCPKPLANGRAMAARAFLGADIVSDRRETVITNCLQIDCIPADIYSYKSGVTISREQASELGNEWAFREGGKDLMLSLQFPPQSAMVDLQLHPIGQVRWMTQDRIEGIATPNLISELVRKSVLVKCNQKGLQFCRETRMYYFPSGLVAGDRLPYRRVDGMAATVNTVGERKYSRSARGERYRYYLAPTFFVSQNLVDNFTMLIRIRVRITDLDGNVLPSRSINSRRKDLCDDWWNHEWLNRTLAVCQFLADDGKITIGALPSQLLIIHAEPLVLTAPKGVDEDALEGTSFDREVVPDEDFEEENDIPESDD